ncbi:MAG TPA: hypothetical protein PKI46_03980 [Bacteroidales bacterium]|nr:hypothetical protein [Bacteroidales bacterium]
MYNDPRSLFQKKIQNILKNEPQEIETVFEKLFTMHQILLLEKIPEIEKDNWKSLLEIYNIIGMKNFIKIVTILKGKTIILPSEEDLKDSILTVMCYYYREVEKKSWKEITKILGVPNLNTIKYGIRLRQLSEYISKKTKGGL